MPNISTFLKPAAVHRSFQDPYVNGVKLSLTIGPTGSGKTTIIMQMLQQIDQRGESAIVYDPACDFVQRFYDESCGDIILNPLDARCPYWGPAEELRRKAEAKAIAASLCQPISEKKGESSRKHPRRYSLTSSPLDRHHSSWWNGCRTPPRLRAASRERNSLPSSSRVHSSTAPVFLPRLDLSPTA